VRAAKFSKKGCSLFFWISPVASGWPTALNFSLSCAWAGRATARALAAAVLDAEGVELLLQVGHREHGVDVLVDALDQCRRQLGRTRQAVPVHRLELGQAELLHRQHAGVGLRAPGACLRQRDDAAVLQVRRRRGHGLEGELDLAADQVGEQRRAALVGHVQRVDTGLQPEHLDREMLDRAWPGRAEGHLTRLGLAQRHHLGEALRRLVRGSDQ
jgi:hypothetical protein